MRCISSIKSCITQQPPPPINNKNNNMWNHVCPNFLTVFSQSFIKYCSLHKKDNNYYAIWTMPITRCKRTDTLAGENVQWQPQSCWDRGGMLLPCHLPIPAGIDSLAPLLWPILILSVSRLLGLLGYQCIHPHAHMWHLRISVFGYTVLDWLIRCSILPFCI